MTKNGLVFGVGINDADYVTADCLIYSRWVGILERCYSSNKLKNYPTYNGCSICDDWVSFSKFKSWMLNQNWQGKHIDKDILHQGNKIYSPTTCVFVSQKLNNLLTTRKSLRGKYPVGVNFHKGTGMYQARCSVDGKSKYIGIFTTADEAYKEYKKYKYSLIASIANTCCEPIRSALLSYKIN